MAAKKESVVGTCALCKRKDVILELSHIIPKFVTRRIINKSVTEFMRNPLEPNQRIQDGDKMYLLCGECEDRFQTSETLFANKVFHPYKNNNQQTFKYEDWLTYFIISVNWRNFYLDLKEYKDDPNLSQTTLDILIQKEEVMRNYLMQKSSNLENIENHLFFFEDIETATEDIVNSEPHTFMRHSSFGYSFLSYDYNGYYVVSNLSGILIFTLLKRSDVDIWVNTQIEKLGTYKIGNERIQSPIITDVLEYIVEVNKLQNRLSEKQASKILGALKKNMNKINISEIYINKLIDKSLK